MVLRKPTITVLYNRASNHLRALRGLISGLAMDFADELVS